MVLGPSPGRRPGPIVRAGSSPAPYAPDPRRLDRPQRTAHRAPGHGRTVVRLRRQREVAHAMRTQVVGSGRTARPDRGRRRLGDARRRLRPARPWSTRTCRSAPSPADWRSRRAPRSSAATTCWSSRRRPARSAPAAVVVRRGDRHRGAGPAGELGVRARAARHRRAPAVPAPAASSTCTGPRARAAQDSTALPDVPLLGNRVDRFQWNGTTLTRERPIVALRARQHDATEPSATARRAADRAGGNHDGGKIVFGRDGKLYIEIGDVGRRGQMQNLPDGPGCVALPCPASRRSAACPTTSTAVPSPTTPTSPAWSCGSTTTARRRATTRSSAPAASAAARSARTWRRSSPTASATPSAWRSTRSPAPSGTRRTATTRSARSTASARGRTSAGSRRWARSRATASSRRSRPTAPRRGRTRPTGYFGLQQTRYSPERLAGTAARRWSGCST